MEQTAEASQRAYARFAGLMYFLIFFGLGSTIFFYVFLKSKYIPKFCQRGASLLPWCTQRSGL
jgi:hypothetical protein